MARAAKAKLPSLLCWFRIKASAWDATIRDPALVSASLRCREQSPTGRLTGETRSILFILAKGGGEYKVEFHGRRPLPNQHITAASLDEAKAVATAAARMLDVIQPDDAFVETLAG